MGALYTALQPQYNAEMPEVIAVLNEKGGSGKTTLSTNLARAFQEAGKDVLLVDTDAQQSALSWWEVQEDFDLPVMAYIGTSVDRWLRANASHVDIVIVDGEPRTIAKMERWVQAADVVLMPVQPSVVDMWAVMNVVELIDAERAERGGPEAAFVLSRADRRTTETTDAAEYLDELEYPLLESYITNRVIYARALGRGSTVLDMDRGKAKAEIMAIYKDVKQMLG